MIRPGDVPSRKIFDLVIVGSGAGALIAALRAKALGLTPIIVEKQGKVGGSTGLSGGVLWIPMSPVLEREGVRDRHELAWTYLTNLVGEDGGRGSTPERWRAFLSEGPEMVRFLEDRGIPFKHCAYRSDYHDELPGGLVEGRSIESKLVDGHILGPWYDHLQGTANPYPLMTSEMRYILLAQARVKGAAMVGRMLYRMAKQRILGKHYLGLGAALVTRLLKLALDAEIPIVINMPVEELLSVDGRVTGVRCSRNGENFEFSARRGVLLAAGGFSHSSRMRQQYGPAPSSTAWTASNPGDTGEVMEQAIGLGAATDKMDFAWWIPTSLLPSGQRAFCAAELAKPGCIGVDQAGERFGNEAGSYVAAGMAMYARQKLRPAVPCWAIMDHRNRSRYAWAGKLPFQTPKEWFASGYMKRADTIEELARLCGIDPARLAATVSRFNGFVDRGRDADYGRGDRHYDSYYADPFHRPSATLGRIDRGPFYAVKFFPGDVGTAGGLVCDEHARVLRDDGTAIEGLYAAGNIAAPTFGATYPGAGASIAPSAVFGFIAAEAAASSG
ncbi:FAD-binding protein [Rhizorhabdus dicambivorans]|uniref:FAD-binding protein n=1 Tax=Rhizorhabdus dicambivorans TaxID=1850238 RepID=UPI000ACB6BB9|nr:FAD-binding protein [Rhizorhabdus dicambivorans]